MASPYAQFYEGPGSDPSLAYDPTALIGTSLPAALEKRNIAYTNLLSQLNGPSYRDLATTPGADQAAVTKRGSLNKNRAALAARGLSGSGAEALSRRGAETAYGTSLLDAFNNADTWESNRKKSLLQSLQGLNQADLQFQQGMEDATLSQYDAATTRQTRLAENNYAPIGALGGILNLAIAAAGAYYGASSAGGAGGTSGALQGAGAASNLANINSNRGYSVGNGVGGYQASSGVDRYGNTGAPLSGGPGGYSLGLTVPPEADSEFLRNIQWAGGSY